jgi:hypothetical protein
LTPGVIRIGHTLRSSTTRQFNIGRPPVAPARGP